MHLQFAAAPSVPDAFTDTKNDRDITFQTTRCRLGPGFKHMATPWINGPAMPQSK